jgi:hypothetical protein
LLRAEVIVHGDKWGQDLSSYLTDAETYALSAASTTLTRRPIEKQEHFAMARKEAQRGFFQHPFFPQSFENCQNQNSTLY